MRRGINIRKKKRIIINSSNKKCLKIIILSVITLVVCVLLFFTFFQNIFIKKSLEKDSTNFYKLNENIPFSLDKIILFSSATAQTDSINQSLSLNISQFCDIAIYLNNSDKNNTSIKFLTIKDIVVSTPELGKPYLYKKKITDLGKCSFDEQNIIENTYDFKVIEDTNSLNFDNYELSKDGLTPITLGFYNKNIKENFITNSTELSYNGTLLKDSLITQTSLNCNVSFSINITTETDESYICNVSIDIPFENEEDSIYDKGYIIKEIPFTQTQSFIRTK